MGSLRRKLRRFTPHRFALHTLPIGVHFNVVAGKGGVGPGIPAIGALEDLSAECHIGDVWIFGRADEAVYPRVFSVTHKILGHAGRSDELLPSACGWVPSISSGDICAHVDQALFRRANIHSYHPATAPNLHLLPAITAAQICGN